MTTERLEGLGADTNRQSRFRVTPKMWTIAGLVALVLVFVFQNTGRGRVHFLWWHIEAPAWLWLLSVFIIGVAIGSIFPWFRRRSK